MNAQAHRQGFDTVLFAFGPAGIAVPMTMRKDEASLSADESARLVAAVAASRDRAAFASLFHHYAPRLKAFMMRGGLASSSAEDLAQETMLLVWKKASYFDPARAGVSTWIFTIARNVRIDRLRRENRPAAIANAVDASDEPDEQATAETLLMVAQREAGVRTAISLLPAEQAEILRMAYFGDKPQSEIAHELGIPLGTVKSRTRLALNRMRAILDDLR